jgi:hypothetical protein
MTGIVVVLYVYVRISISVKVIPNFVSYSNFLSGSTLFPSPLPCVKVSYSVYRQCVTGSGGGGGVLNHVADVGNHILQVFNSLYLTRFRTYKIARPP